MEEGSVSSKSIAIIGGGISGLTAAHALVRAAQQQGAFWDITLFETESSLGGSIKTLKQDGVIMDLGPECFVATKPAVLELVDELGLTPSVIPQARRTTYISRRSILHDLPEGIFSMSFSKLRDLLGSKIMSLPGKLRMGVEPFVARAHREDENAAEFIIRRFGHECLENLAEPLIGGIYGNDPEALSARLTLPFLVALEESHGSVVRGFIHRRNVGSKRDVAIPMTMATFEQGMGSLVAELQASLEHKCTIINKEIISIERGNNGHRWEVHWKRGMKQADVVIIAVPAKAAGCILQSVDRSLAVDLQSIYHSSPIVANLAYDRTAIEHTLQGSGFLVPRQERRSLRACSFSSSKFAGRAPFDKVLLRVSLNTLTMPELRTYSDAEIETVITRDLRDYLSIAEDPQSAVITRHHNAIPWFSPGHEKLVSRIESQVERLDGICIIGNSYSGMGVSDCIARARREASRIVQDFALSA